MNLKGYIAKFALVSCVATLIGGIKIGLPWYFIVAAIVFWGVIYIILDWDNF